MRTADSPNHAPIRVDYFPDTTLKPKQKGPIHAAK
jgi:hypothetical protein